jgi:outer membrane protein assembly factor BamB
MKVRYVPFLLLASAAMPAAAQDVLLIPDSDGDRVWAFSAADGQLIDDSFITDPGSVGGVDVFNRPLEVLLGSDGNLLISDQFADVVSEFAPDGSFIRVFSLGGVRDTNIMDNIRGGHVLTQGPNAGDVLITNSGRLNDLVISQKNVKSFAADDGAEQGDFVFNRYGGIRGPFDVIEYNGEVLVADEGQDKIVRYTMDGKFNERFTSSFDVPQLDFPQQMAIAANGNLLVCSFSAGVILEFDPGANLVGQYDPGTLELYRGIAELDNGNLLVTTTSGVFEVNRAGVVIDVEATDGDFRYITRMPVMGRAAALTPDTQSLPMPAPDARDRETILADERGQLQTKEGGDS